MIIRRARARDCYQIASLYNSWTAGLAERIWRDSRPDASSMRPLEIGAWSLASGTGLLGLEDCFVARNGTELLGFVGACPSRRILERHKESPIHAVLSGAGQRDSWFIHTLATEQEPTDVAVELLAASLRDAMGLSFADAVTVVPKSRPARPAWDQLGFTCDDKGTGNGLALWRKRLQ